MSLIPIYTIGHGARKSAVFTELLKRYGIRYLADVRSRPYSRFHQQFNRETLQQQLALENIIYVFMGDELGGRPADPASYTDGRPDYDIMRNKDHFKKGIARLQTAFARQVPLAIMCSERDPLQCHRTWLIAPALIALDMDVKHIDERGNLVSHTTLMSSGSGELFG